MNKYIVSLLISILVIACNRTTYVTLPPGRYYYSVDSSFYGPNTKDTFFCDMYAFDKKKGKFRLMYHPDLEKEHKKIDKFFK